MHQLQPTRGVIAVRYSITLMVTAILFALACNDTDALHLVGTGGSAGWGGAVAGQGAASGAAAGSLASSAGSSGLVGHAGSSEVASSGGVTGSAGANASAGSGGSAGAGSAGSGGSAGNAGSGGSGPTSNCSAGGALFVVGNYADAAGNQFMLRTAAKAATFALVPSGVADPSNPPRLFLVNRLCAPGGAMIVSDGSSNYRVDFSQTGNQLAVCWSASVTTPEAAWVLPGADAAHAADTGCAGHAFTIYSAVAL